MWELETSWQELIVRSFFLFVGMLVLFRLTNRGGGELSPIDQVTLITIGNLAASAALKSDDSISAAIIAMSTFVCLSALMNYITYKSRKASRMLEGVPKVLVHNGKILWECMKEERVNEKELMQAMREAGIQSILNVHAAFMEINGRITVIKKSS